MDPYRSQRVRKEAFIAYGIGVLVTYALLRFAGFAGGRIFTTLVIVAIGGLFYKWRRIL